MRCGSTLALIYVTACQTVETRATVSNLFVTCFTNADGDATYVITHPTRVAFMFWENDCCIYTFCLSSAPQGENPIYKSAVTTVVNPKYEGK